VEVHHFEHVVAQLLPSFGFRKDGLTQHASDVSALLRLAPIENQFHTEVIADGLCLREFPK
jgi:hypothetical protein